MESETDRYSDIGTRKIVFARGSCSFLLSGLNLDCSCLNDPSFPRRL